MISLAAAFTNCIYDVEQWMASNRLKLNRDKTEMLWLASRNTMRSIGSAPSVGVGNADRKFYESFAQLRFEVEERVISH